jgi:subtilase family serine protease
MINVSQGATGTSAPPPLQFRAATGAGAAAPLWAGVIALAGQEAGRHLGLVNPAIYAIARRSAYHHAFHDVTTGSNSVQWHTTVFTGCEAGPGWDPVTGRGSPDAQYLVPLLARTATPRFRPPPAGEAIRSALAEWAVPRAREPRTGVRQ